VSADNESHVLPKSLMTSGTVKGTWT